MSILFHCPRCQVGLRADDRLAGLIGSCPKCSSALLYPGDRVLAPAAAARLAPAERTARPQRFLDRLRTGLVASWAVSLLLHAAVVLVLAALTWRVAAPAGEPLHKVNILLDMGTHDGGLKYRGPREVKVNKPARPKRDLLADLARNRPRSDLIEVGPAPGAPVIPLKDLQFNDAPGGGFVTEFMGVGARGESFVFIVDRSGSMDGGRLGAAKSELCASIDMLPYAATFHVIFFSHGPIRELPGDALVNASRSNKKRLFAKLDGIGAAGGTDPAEAFRKAFDLKPDVIFFLSDGQVAKGVTLAKRIRLMNRERAHDRITIHTIGFIDNVGEALLKKIAAENHGTYRFVDAAAARRMRRPTGTVGRP